MQLNDVRDLFAVPAKSPSLAAAQLSALKKQVPLLYVLLTVNAGSLAYTHYGLAPHALVLLPFLALASVCVVRAISWTRLDVNGIAPGSRVALLQRTQWITMLLSPCTLAWSLSMALYGSQVAHLHVFFFLALTSIGCIFCLMHLRSAALVVASTVIAPAIIFVFYQRGVVLTAIALNLLLVAGVMLFMLFIHYRDFVRLVGQNQALERLGEQNLELALVDMLTGLPNRRSFFPTLDAVVARERTTATSFALGIIDLDGFKGINDTYGHVAGDQVLVEAAQRFLHAIPAGATLARLGGDEFALIVEEDAGNQQLERVSGQILKVATLPFACAGTTVRIGASIGFALAARGVNSAEMIERADFALYEAKAHSRGACVVFNDEHEARMRLRTAVEDSLRHADLKAELSLAFQPIVDVDEGRTIAFEALARWDSPVLGKVPPDRFIAIAERTGLVSEITAILFDQALRELAGWPTDVALSFNLSMVDITSPEAVDRLCTMIHRSGIDTDRIHFEVTETAMLSDFEQARAGLGRLKAMGCRLSLDDFGTGYSSLAHLHRLPVDKLKVDQSFTRELATSDVARNIIASTVTLARNLGLACIVEGVETHDQAVILRGFGCRHMQGYLFHRPIPAASVAGYLEGERADTPVAVDSSTPTASGAPSGTRYKPQLRILSG